MPRNSAQSLSDANLLTQTHELVKRERETTTEILHLLREIERRKLFSTLGCSSLFDFCTRILGYAEGSAQRRIASMRLLREIPEIESQIQSGELTLSVVSQAQSFFRAEAKVSQGLSPTAKREVLSALQGKSTREAERELIKRSSQPAALIQERVRNVTETHVELKLILPQETLDDLERLKGLLAHAFPNLSMSELVTLLAKKSLEQMDARSQPRKKSAQPSPPAEKPREVIRAPVSTPVPTFVPSSRRVPLSLRRAVFRRDHYRCTKCKSYYALELDHRIPFAQGGATTFENLRVLCRACNRRHAIETYGLEKIEKDSLLSGSFHSLKTS